MTEIKIIDVSQTPPPLHKITHTDRYNRLLSIFESVFDYTYADNTDADYVNVELIGKIRYLTDMVDSMYDSKIYHDNDNPIPKMNELLIQQLLKYNCIIPILSAHPIPQQSSQSMQLTQQIPQPTQSNPATIQIILNASKKYMIGLDENAKFQDTDAKQETYQASSGEKIHIIGLAFTDDMLLSEPNWNSIIGMRTNISKNLENVDSIATSQRNRCAYARNFIHIGDYLSKIDPILKKYNCKIKNVNITPDIGKLIAVNAVRFSGLQVYELLVGLLGYNYYIEKSIYGDNASIVNIKRIIANVGGIKCGTIMNNVMPETYQPRKYDPASDKIIQILNLSGLYDLHTYVTQHNLDSIFGKSVLYGADTDDVVDELKIFRANNLRQILTHKTLLSQQNRLNDVSIVLDIIWKKLHAQVYDKIQTLISRVASLTVNDILDNLSENERKLVKSEFDKYKSFIEHKQKNRCDHHKLTAVLYKIPHRLHAIFFNNPKHKETQKGIDGGDDEMNEKIVGEDSKNETAGEEMNETKNKKSDEKIRNKTTPDNNSDGAIMQKIREYINFDDIQNNIKSAQMINCKLCKYPILCPHKIELSSSGTKRSTINLFNKYLGSSSQLDNKYFCKVCGEYICSSEQYKSLIHQDEPLEDNFNDDLKKIMFDECMSNMNIFVVDKFVNVKNFVNNIINTLFPIMREIDIRLMKSKTDTDEELDNKRRIYSLIYIFVYIAHLITSDISGIQLRGNVNKKTDILTTILREIIRIKYSTFLSLGINEDFIKSQLLNAYQFVKIKISPNKISLNSDDIDIIQIIMFDPIYKYICKNYIATHNGGRELNKDDLYISSFEKIIGVSLGEIRNQHKKPATKKTNVAKKSNDKKPDDDDKTPDDDKNINDKSDGKLSNDAKLYIYDNYSKRRIIEKYDGFNELAFGVIKNSNGKRRITIRDTLDNKFNDLIHEYKAYAFDRFWERITNPKILGQSIFINGDKELIENIKLHKHDNIEEKIEQLRIEGKLAYNVHTPEYKRFLDGKKTIPEKIIQAGLKFQQQPIMFTAPTLAKTPPQIKYQYSRIYDETGRKHKWDTYIYENGTTMNMKDILATLSPNANNSKRGKLIDVSCSDCGIKKSETNKLNEATILNALNHNNELLRFKNYYVERCPVDGIHKFEMSTICVKCSFDTSWTIYDKNFMLYYTKFKNVFAEVVGEISNIIDSVNKQKIEMPDDAKIKTLLTDTYSKYSFDFNILTAISNKYHINIHLLNNLGATERISYDEISKGRIPNVPTSANTDDINTLISYLRLIIIAYNHIRYYNSIVNHTEFMQDVIKTSNIQTSELRDIGKNAKDISVITIGDMNMSVFDVIRHFQYTKKPRDTRSFILEQIGQSFITIDKNKTPATAELFDVFCHKMLGRIIYLDSVRAKHEYFSWSIFGSKVQNAGLVNVEAEELNEGNVDALDETEIKSSANDIAEGATGDTSTAFNLDGFDVENEDEMKIKLDNE